MKARCAAVITSWSASTPGAETIGGMLTRSGRDGKQGGGSDAARRRRHRAATSRSGMPVRRSTGAVASHVADLRGAAGGTRREEARRGGNQ